MTRYAEKTEVPVDQSRVEIERTVRKYSADGFFSGWKAQRAAVQFRCKGRYVRLTVTLPERGKIGEKYKRGAVMHGRTAEQVEQRWEQARRQVWRALALLVKAKLEAVESGIVTFEQEFFSHVVMPDGMTVYEKAREQVEVAYQTGKVAALLPDYSGRP